MRALALLMVVLFGAGCDEQSKEPLEEAASPVDSRGHQLPANRDADEKISSITKGEPGAKDDDTKTTPEAPPAAVYVNRAARCSECHSHFFEQWEGSSHAAAASSELYLKSRKESADPSCDGCHAPLRGKLPKELARIADEGVTCDVCHTLREVTLRDSGADMTLELRDNVRYGPLCDAKDHYFHRMGCSPLHAESRLCASCHFYERVLPSGERLPVFTEYSDWKAGPLARDGVACQVCHMPDAHGEVATGAGTRNSVSHHGFLGEENDLRREALKVRASITVAGDAVKITARVQNVGAGHAVPAGIPGRRLILRARVLDASGEERSRDERVYARILGDSEGREVPFFVATRVVSDSRIAPLEARREVLTVSTTDIETGELVLELISVAWPEALARAVDAKAPAKEVVKSVRYPITARGSRRGLPTRARLKP